MKLITRRKVEAWLRPMRLALREIEKLGISDQTVNYRIIKGIPLDAKKWGGSRG